jgi:hypothetical protein
MEDIAKSPAPQVRRLLDRIKEAMKANGMPEKEKL